MHGIKVSMCVLERERESWRNGGTQSSSSAFFAGSGGHLTAGRGGG